MATSRATRIIDDTSTNKGKQWVSLFDGEWLLCDTAAYVCCVTRLAMTAMSHDRNRLLCDTADIVCCVAQQTMSAMSHGRQYLL